MTRRAFGGSSEDHALETQQKMQEFFQLRHSIVSNLEHKPGYCRHVMRDLIKAAHLLGLADAHGRYGDWKRVVPDSFQRGAEAAKLRFLADRAMSRCGCKVDG